MSKPQSAVRVMKSRGADLNLAAAETLRGWPYGKTVEGVGGGGCAELWQPFRHL